jgi:hypothetical protein
MNIYILFGIYILVPLLTSWSYQRLGIKDQKILLHIFTAFLILIYPYFIYEIDDSLDPRKSEDKFESPLFGMLILNAIIMVPLTQMLLYFFNTCFEIYNEKKSIEQIDTKPDLTKENK